MKKALLIIPFITAPLVSCNNNCRVTFDTNGGSEVASQTIAMDSPVQIPEDPIKEGHNFEGWYLDNNSFNYKFNFDQPICSNVTLYAKWNNTYDEATIVSNTLKITQTIAEHTNDLVVSFYLKDGLDPQEWVIPIDAPFYSVSINGRIYRNFTPKSYMDPIPRTEITIKRDAITGPITISAEAYEKHLTLTANNDNTKIHLKLHLDYGDRITCDNLDYQIRKATEKWPTNWTRWNNVETTQLELNANDQIRFWNRTNRLFQLTGSSSTFNLAAGHAQFVCDTSEVTLKASGNILSLLNFNTSIPQNGFAHLFDSFPIETVPAIPKCDNSQFATSYDFDLGGSGFVETFANCTLLKKAPVIFATNANDIQLYHATFTGMFKNCSNLEEAHVFTFADANMFENCSKLKLLELNSGTAGSTSWSCDSTDWMRNAGTSCPGPKYFVWKGETDIKKLKNDGKYGNNSCIANGWIVCNP